MTIKRVVVEAELGIEREHLSVLGFDERVNLHHVAIEGDEELVEILEEFAKLLGRGAFKSRAAVSLRISYA